MGFHVYPQNLVPYNIGIKREKADMKFYLNAGSDTYNVAKLFQQKCEQDKINYYFKVVRGNDEEEYYRPDKMCIYSEFGDAEKFLKIIREIKKENPDINFQDPPILAGRIEDFIGVGMDHINNGGSYNEIMSKICYNAMANVFKGIPRRQIQSYVKQNPQMLEMLKDKIEEEAGKIGLSREKICVSPGVKQKLEGTKEEETKLKFLYKFSASYRRLETNDEYDRRMDREEYDMEHVAKYVNDIKAGKVNHDYFSIFKNEITDKTGKRDFSEENIERLYRLFKAAHNMSIDGNNSYFKFFCKTPEISKLIDKMNQSTKIKNLINNAERAKQNEIYGSGHYREITPAEKDRKNLDIQKIKYLME